jgi:HD-GYP domain-containing protein (c-di-GMP phosphodiesterase class II)
VVDEAARRLRADVLTPAAILANKPRAPLFVLLLAVVLVVAVVPLTVFGLLTLHDMREAMVVGEQERQLRLAASVSDRIDAFVKQEGREAVRLAEAISASGAPGGRGGSGFLTELLDDTVVMIRFQPVRGAQQLAAAPELVIPPALEERLDHEASLVRQAGAAPGPPAARDARIVGPIPLGPERIMAVAVTAPVQQEGRLLGVLQQVALFQGVWEDVASSVRPPMRLFLLDEQAGVIAHNDVSSVPGPRARGARRMALRDLLRAPGSSRGVLSYSVGGDGGEEVTYLGSYAQTRQGWVVFVEVDRDLALAPADRITRDVTFSGLVAAGMAIVAALILGAVISRPMARLAAISTRLAGGDFSVRARRSPVRELDALGDNFNRMAGRLGDLVERFRAAAQEANAMFLGTIRSLAEAIDEKDPYTKGHSVRVNRYAVIIGRYMGLSRDAIRALHVSALLHDVGKIGIDDSVLKKPAALTSDEFSVMKTHPERGSKIMGRIPQMKDIIPGIRFHHERWDGSGYPLGLRGEEIPIQARIIAVADTFDAMTTERPYQKSLSLAEAVALVNDMKRIGFDPEVVEAFNRAYEAGEMQEVARSRRAAADSAEDEPQPSEPEGGQAAAPAGASATDREPVPAGAPR